MIGFYSVHRSGLLQAMQFLELKTDISNML